jgi:hypothetical protein
MPQHWMSADKIDAKECTEWLREQVQQQIAFHSEQVEAHKRQLAHLEELVREGRRGQGRGDAARARAHADAHGRRAAQESERRAATSPRRFDGAAGGVAAGERARRPTQERDQQAARRL